MTLLEKLGTKLQEKQIEEVKLQKALEQKALQKQLAEQRQQEEAEAIEKVSSLQTEINRLQGIANTLSNKHGLKLDYLTSLEALRGSKAEFKQADQEFENLIWQAANPDYKTKDDILKDKDLSNEEEVVIWKEKEMGLMQKVGERQGKKEALTQSEAKTSTVSLKAELKELIPDEKFSFTKDKAQESLDKITQVLQQKTAELLKYEKKTPEYKEKLKARHKEYPTNVSVQDLQDAKIAEKGGEELIKGLIVENAKDMMQKEARQTNFGKVEAELQKINKSMEAWPQAKKSIEDLAKRGDKVFAEILELIPKPSRDRLEESRKVDPDLLHFFNAQDQSHAYKQVFWLVETAFSPNGSLKNLIRVWDNTQGNAPITEALNKTQYFETIEKQYTTLKQDIQKQTSVPNCQYIMDSTQEGHKVLNELEEFVNNEAKRQEVMQHKNNSDSQQYSFRLDREHTRGSGEMNIHLDYNILTRDKFTNLASLEKYVALENAKIQEKMEVENQRVELQVGINWENQKVEQMPTEAIRAGYRIEQEQEVTEKISSALTSLEIKTLDKGNELVRILRTRVGSPLEFTLPEDPRGTETPLKKEIAQKESEIKKTSEQIKVEGEKKWFASIGKKGRIDQLNDNKTDILDLLKPLKKQQEDLDLKFGNINVAFTNLMEVLSKNLNNNRLESLLKQESAFDEPLKIDNLIKKLKNLTESLKNQKLSGKESQIYEDYKESESIKKYLQSKLSKLPRQS